MPTQRQKVQQLKAGDLIRVKIYRDRIGQRGGLPTYSQAFNLRDSELVSVKAVGRAATHPPGNPWQLIIQLGDGCTLAGYWKANHTHMVGLHRLVIDADCPSCGWPERWFDRQTKRFGCNHCTYTSRERER